MGKQCVHHNDIFSHLPSFDDKHLLSSANVDCFLRFSGLLCILVIAGLHKIKGHVEAIHRFTFEYVFNY